MQQQPEWERRAAGLAEEMAAATSEEEGSDDMRRTIDSLLFSKTLIILMRFAMTVTPVLVGLAWSTVNDISHRLADEQTLLLRYGDRITAVEQKASEADNIALRANRDGAVTTARFNDLMNRVLHIEQVVTDQKRSGYPMSTFAPPG